MDKRKLIEKQVYEILKPYTLDIDEIKGDLRLLKDLRVDDMDIIPSLEKITGAKPPIKEWEKILTIDELIDLLLKYSPLGEEFHFNEEMGKAQKILAEPFTLSVKIASIFFAASFVLFILFTIHKKPPDFIFQILWGCQIFLMVVGAGIFCFASIFGSKRESQHRNSNG